MIIRVNHNTNYTVMSNVHLRDKTLSLKAKGLLSQMLSLPPEWDFSIDGLVSLNAEKKNAISSALSELRYHGYLVVTKLMSNQTKSGRFEYVYDVYEVPQRKPHIEKPDMEIPYMENPDVEIPVMENQPLLNKEEVSTDNKVKKNQVKRFIPPTVEEVQAYCDERKNGVDAQRFVDYYTRNGWMCGKSKMKDWKASVRLWERNDYSRKPVRDSALDEVFG